MRIDGYEIEREIFSNEYGLAVYEVTSLNNGQRHMLRLLDVSSHQEGLQQDKWYEVYEKYQLTITNFKYLPRVFSINMIDEFRSYTILEGEEGRILKSKGQIGLEQVLQLIDAVHHLHQKKVVHGSIYAENIWLTNKGRVVLYGAGESTAINGSQQHDVVADVKQLVDVICQYSVLDKEVIRHLKIENPSTIAELESIVWKTESLQTTENEKKSGGLVEKGELTLFKEISVLAAEKEKPPLRSNRPKEKSEQPSRSFRDKRAFPYETRKRAEKRRRRTSPWMRRFVAGMAGIFAILLIHELFSYLQLQKIPTLEEQEIPVAVEQSPSFEEQKPLTEVSEERIWGNQDEEQIEVQEEIQEVPAPVVYTIKEVEAFMKEYAVLSEEALKQQNFSLVEPLIDPAGSIYQEQLDYYNNAENSGIIEEMSIFNVIDIEQTDQSTYKVSAHEEYNVVYRDAQKETKRFNSVYIVKIVKDEQLAVNERIYEQEFNPLKSSEEEQDNEVTVTESDMAIFMEEYIKAREEAIQQDDFAYVEKLLDRNGSAYQEVQNHIQSLNGDNIPEILLTYSIGDLTQLDESSYKAVVYEEYRLPGSNETMEVQSYKCEYVITWLDGQLVVHEQSKTEINLNRNEEASPIDR
ncbi:TcaA NTF2-like domain-containing protein [Priestia abyssalis]|uniref:TcaA NTF2-like domain-containing protein n=1 Tax=Priestia abyssalis TaxID=1221450 RepID=UPI000994E140|nr:hypothetical protein [Priestia abyssalis]